MAARLAVVDIHQLRGKQDAPIEAVCAALKDVQSPGGGLQGAADLWDGLPVSAMDVLIGSLRHAQVHLAATHNAVSFAIDFVPGQQLQSRVRVAVGVQRHADVLALVRGDHVRG